MWEEGFGWTWLGYEPWGWAPYHYGRWYHSARYGWCWYPERAFVAWRPAVVAFVGFGGFSFGFGDIGWVPLAPYETYYPWWGTGYGNNVTYVTNNYYYVHNGTTTDNNDAVNNSKPLDQRALQRRNVRVAPEFRRREFRPSARGRPVEGARRSIRSAASFPPCRPTPICASAIIPSRRT